MKRMMMKRTLRRRKMKIERRRMFERMMIILKIMAKHSDRYPLEYGGLLNGLLYYI